MKKVDIANFIISYLSIVIAFIITLGRTRVFTVEEVGVYSYVLSISAITSVILSFGIPRIILRYYEANRHNKFIKTILLYQVLIFILFIFFYIIMKKYLDISYIEFVFFLVFNQLTITNLDTISIVTHKSVKSNFYQTIIMQSLNIATLITLFVLEGNIYQYLYSFIVIQFIVIILLFILVKENIWQKSLKVFEQKLLKEYFYYGLFVMLNAAAATLILNIDNLMVKHYIGFEAVAVYAISFSIAVVIGMVGNVFARSVPPKIAKYLENNNFLELENIYKNNTQQQIYIGLFLLILLTLFSREILSLMGPDYVEGFMVLILIALGQMIHIGTGMCGTIIGLSKYFKYEAYFNGFLLLLTIATNVMLIPTFGVVGAALASLLTILLINTLKVVFVYMKFKIHPYKLIDTRYLLAGFIIFIILHTIKYYIVFNIIEIGVLSVFIFILYDGILYMLKDREILTLKLLHRIREKKGRKI